LKWLQKLNLIVDVAKLMKLFSKKRIVTIISVVQPNGKIIAGIFVVKSLDDHPRK
jgi:hypothetical protein